MPILLPDLDDRRWADLVEEGRALIPLYGPPWTDHNVHDPGITAMELFAAITEMDVYQLNRIPERHRRKFLNLVGIHPQPPQPARVVLSFTMSGGSPPLELPADAEFEGTDPFGHLVSFRTLDTVRVVSGGLGSILMGDEEGFRNLTGRWQHGEPVAPLGQDPRPGAALYLGFSQALPADEPVSLFFTFAGQHAKWDERLRLLREQARRAADCRITDPLVRCPDGLETVVNEPEQPPAHQPLAHHSARTVWEFLAAGGRWLPLDPRAGEVLDGTRQLTLDGPVIVRVPGTMTATRDFAPAETARYYLRCRFVAGAYDAAPVLEDIAFNAVAAEQAVPAFSRMVIARGATLDGTLPQPGDLVAFRMQIDDRGEILRISFLPRGPELPAFRVLELQPPSTGTAGVLSLEAAFLGRGTGAPYQRHTIPEGALVVRMLEVFTQELARGSAFEAWRTWADRHDLDASGRSDAHFVAEAGAGTIAFGDGDRGRVPPWGSLIFAVGLVTQAESGNLRKGAVARLADSLHNRAMLPGTVRDQFRDRLVGVRNPVPADGGSAAETLMAAAGRALRLIEAPQRAVTLADCKTLARETPGVQLARAFARSNMHAGLPCLHAPGMIAVAVLPYLPAARPTPSAGLRRAVAAYLSRRRVIGTRVEVVEPVYRQVAVQAQVKAGERTDRTELRRRITAVLNRFFDPLTGGRNGSGWPFGRDVYRAEVMEVITQTAGVDHVLTLEFLVDGHGPVCGNVCLGPMDLVAAGAHQIEIV